ncbi:MAG: YraN family protein [Candidatus Limnocylindrales bacterium]
MVTRTLRQRHGDAGEAVAAAYLAGLGWRIVGRQVPVGRDEVDVVAVDPGPPATLVVVEVRTRTGDQFGPPEASVDRAKLTRCYRAAGALRRARALPDGTRLPSLPWRVDVVAVELGAGTDASHPVRGPRVRHLRAVLMP